MPRYCVELARCLARTDEVAIFARTVEAEIPTKTVIRFPWSFHSKRIEYGPNTLVNSALLRLGKRRLGLDVVNTQGAELIGIDVITAHGTWWGHYRAHAAADPAMAAELRKSVMPLVERANYRGHRYRRVIAVSELAKRELQTIYGVAPEDIDVIPLGVDTSRFRFDGARRKMWRSSMGFDGETVLLHVTTDFVRKGLRTIIRALPAIEGKARLVVVGREDPAPYTEDARKLGVDDRVSFIPYAPTIEDFYVGSDVFVFPSDYEAFGLSVLEAMASGLPVICTRGLGVTDILTDGVDALLLNRWDDPEELAAKVNSLGREPRRTLGTSAQRTAQAYSWERTAARTREVYEASLRR